MKKTEIAVVESATIPVELTELVEKSKMDLTKAQQHAVRFMPFMAKVNELSIPLQTMDKDNPTPEMAKLARATRLLMVPNRTDMDAVKADAKEQILVEGRLIDGLYNVVLNASKLTEGEYMAIEKHIERKEAEAKLATKNARIAELEPYNVPGVEYMQLDLMSDEQYSQLLSGSKLAYETRIAAEKKAEEDRIEAERIAAEEEAERKRLEAIENERIRVENERLQKEAAAKEKELAAERAKQEAANKAAADAAEKLRLENEAKLTAERKERERIESELRAKQEAEDARLLADKQRIEAEENERLAKEKAAMLAPDKEKVNALFLSVKAIEIPEFQTEEAKALGKLVSDGLAIVLQGIKDAAKLIK